MNNKAEKPDVIQGFEESGAALANRLGIEEENYYPPCIGGMYGIDLYLWDSVFISEALAEHGRFRKAARQIFAVLAGQRPDGSIANMQFPPGKVRYYPEHYTFMNPSLESDYTQPPILAEAVADIYDSAKTSEAASADEELDPDLFVEVAFTYLDRYYGYLADTRQNSPDDPLLGNIHPHETGRDSDPTFDFIKFLRIKRIGEYSPLPVNKWNRLVDYAGAMALNLQHRANNWEIEKVREDFWMNDVMFNSIYAKNLYHMASLAGKLGRPDKIEHYKQLAASVESQIYERMFDRSADDGRGGFYNLDRDGEFINKKSINNLMAVLLPNISPKKLEAVLDMMDRSFDAPFPLPSVATDESEYDPHYEEHDRHWRGPTWPVTNHLVLEGLVYQANRDDLPSWLIDRCSRWITNLSASNAALSDNGNFEHYDPITSQGQRGHRTKGHIFGAIADIPPRLHKLRLPS